VAAQIARMLREENPEVTISDSAVLKYVNSIKHTISTDAFQKIRAHVDKVVPDDLAALESMEAMCLAWANEAEKDVTDRITEAAADLEHELDQWRSIITDTGGDKRPVTQLINRAVSLIQKDSRQQENRLKAMRQAVQIIDLKLRQAGLLDDDTKGRIVLNLNGKKTAGGEDDDGYTPFRVLKGGGDE
jgi:hypothetical protein